MALVRQTQLDHDCIIFFINSARLHLLIVFNLEFMYMFVYIYILYIGLKVVLCFHDY